MGNSTTKLQDFMIMIIFCAACAVLSERKTKVKSRYIKPTIVHAFAHISKMSC